MNDETAARLFWRAAFSDILNQSDAWFYDLLNLLFDEGQLDDVEWDTARLPFERDVVPALYRAAGLRR